MRYGGRPDIFSPIFRATLKAISEGRKVMYEERVAGRKVAVVVVSAFSFSLFSILINLLSITDGSEQSYDR